MSTKATKTVDLRSFLRRKQRPRSRSGRTGYSSAPPSRASAEAVVKDGARQEPAMNSEDASSSQDYVGAETFLSETHNHQFTSSSSTKSPDATTTTSPELKLSPLLDPSPERSPQETKLVSLLLSQKDVIIQQQASDLTALYSTLQRRDGTIETLSSQLSEMRQELQYSRQLAAKHKQYAHIVRDKFLRWEKMVMEWFQEQKKKFCSALPPPSYDLSQGPAARRRQHFVAEQKSAAANRQQVDRTEAVNHRRDEANRDGKKPAAPQIDESNKTHRDVDESQPHEMDEKIVASTTGKVEESRRQEPARTLTDPKKKSTARPDPLAQRSSAQEVQSVNQSPASSSIASQESSKTRYRATDEAVDSFPMDDSGAGSPEGNVTQSSKPVARHGQVETQHQSKKQRTRNEAVVRPPAIEINDSSTSDDSEEESPVDWYVRESMSKKAADATRREQLQTSQVEEQLRATPVEASTAATTATKPGRVQLQTNQVEEQLRVTPATTTKPTSSVNDSFQQAASDSEEEILEDRYVRSLSQKTEPKATACDGKKHQPVTDERRATFRPIESREESPINQGVADTPTVRTDKENCHPNNQPLDPRRISFTPKQQCPSPDQQQQNPSPESTQTSSEESGTQLTRFVPRFTRLMPGYGAQDGTEQDQSQENNDADDFPVPHVVQTEPKCWGESQLTMAFETYVDTQHSNSPPSDPSTKLPSKVPHKQIGKPAPQALNTTKYSATTAINGWRSSITAKSFMNEALDPTQKKSAPARAAHNPATTAASAPKNPYKSTSGQKSNNAAQNHPKQLFSNGINRSQPPPAASAQPKSKDWLRKTGNNTTTKKTDAFFMDDDDDESAVDYKHAGVVRGKRKRACLPGHACAECDPFWSAVCDGNDIYSQRQFRETSRHRAAHSPENTPPDFWELSFVDEIRARREAGGKK